MDGTEKEILDDSEAVSRYVYRHVVHTICDVCWPTSPGCCKGTFTVVEHGYCQL